MLGLKLLDFMTCSLLNGRTYTESVTIVWQQGLD